MDIRTMTEVAAHETHPDLFPSTKVIELVQKARAQRDEIQKLQEWWIAAAKSGCPEIPDVLTNDTVFGCTVYNYSSKYMDSGYIDVEATNKVLAQIIQWARKRGYHVEKEYKDSYFILRIRPDELDTEISWYTNRQTVCEKKVVGKEIVPATEREIVEWDCKSISFLGIES